MGQPLSLKAMYASRSARYRDLNILQSNSVRALTPREVIEQRDLGVMAKFDLFDPTAGEAWLQEASQRYKQFRQDPEYPRKRDEIAFGVYRGPERFG